MKFVIWICLGICMAAEPLQAEMLKSTAKAKALALWGRAGMIGDEELGTAYAMTRLVGVNSVGCFSTFTVLGRGATWDLAFADYTEKLTAGKIVVHGPWRGIVLLRIQATDDQGVVGFQYLVDAKPWGPELMLPIAKTWDTSAGFDTAQLPNGFHVLCSSVRDGAGNVGPSLPFFFRSDQALPMTGFRPGSGRIAPPVVTTPALAPK